MSAAVAKSAPHLACSSSGCCWTDSIRQVPWYRENLGLTSDEVPLVDWTRFATLPTLARATLQAATDALTARELPRDHGRMLWHTTTGSTGRPLRCASSELTNFFNNALTLRETLWYRRDLGATLMIIRASAEEGRFPNWGPATMHLCDTGSLVVLDVHHSLERQVDHIARERPAYLLTYASNAHALATHCLQAGVRLTGIRELRTYGELPARTSPSCAVRPSAAR